MVHRPGVAPPYAGGTRGRAAAPPSPRRIAGIALPYRRRHYRRTGKAIKLQKLIYH